MAFVAVTYKDIETFLKRAFRALDPKPGPIVHGELTYTLKLSPRLYVGIYTSVHKGSESAAGVGSDAIRVGPVFLAPGDLKPIRRRGSFPIVKRTESWKDTLREKIEDVILEYDHDPTMGRGY